MSMAWLHGPTSPAWQIGHSVLAMISLYRTATVGIQDPNKAPTVNTRHSEHSFVVFVLVLLPRAIQLYLGTSFAFFAARAGLAIASPSKLQLICKSCPPMWLTLAGIAGYLLSWAGAELRGLCYQTLGKYFTFRLAVQEDQPLITSGPYAYLRHPGYLGAFLQGFGMELSLILANPISLCYGRNLFKYSKEVEIILLILGFFPGIVAMLRRMTEEEMMMKAKIGKEYTDWERRTWRLIPFIY